MKKISKKKFEKLVKESVKRASKELDSENLKKYESFYRELILRNYKVIANES